MAYVHEERSLGELFDELTAEARTLVRQEVQLAKLEMSEKARDAGRDVTFLIMGGAVAYAGLLALVYAAILGLGEVVGNGWSALIVGVVVAGIGYLLLQKGLSDLKRVDPVPQRTLETLREDQEWMKRQVD
ncbi:MAG: phage holin family protein [Chloroflexota bacterium]